MRRLLLLVLVAALTLPARMAVAGGSTEPAAAVGGAIRLSFWYTGGDEARKAYFLETVQLYEKAHPDVKLELVEVPGNAADIETKLNAAQLSGTFPDVFEAYLAFIGTRGSKGDFAVLDTYVAGWKDKADMYESALALGNYQGKVLGIGFAPAPEILVYRKDFYREAGLDPARPPRTWEELADYAVKLTVRDGAGSVTRAGLDLPAVDPAVVFTEPFMRSNGSAVIDEIAFKPAWADDAGVEALQFLVDLKKKNISIPFNQQQVAAYPFMSNRSAMAFRTPPTLMSLFQADPAIKEKIGYVPPIGRKKTVTFCGYRLWTIGAASKQKDGAWALVEFLMSPDQTWRRYEVARYPVVRESLTARFVADDRELNGAIVEYVKTGKGKAVTPFTTIANKYMSVAYEEAMSGAKTPRQALVDAEAAVLKEMR
jgi:ABC-type glycerol-3-phosphate transport system substrate-binding protein